MDEGGGTSTADASGNGNTGTLNKASWATGSYGTSIALSGNNSYVYVNESSSIELSKQLTVAFWMYATTNANVDPRVVSKLYSWDVIGHEMIESYLGLLNRHGRDLIGSLPTPQPRTVLQPVDQPGPC